MTVANAHRAGQAPYDGLASKKAGGRISRMRRILRIEQLH